MGKSKNKSVFNSPFELKNTSLHRRENVRVEKKIKEGGVLLCFNLKDFDSKQCPPGQTYEEWQKDCLLAGLMRQLENMSQYTIPEAITNGILKIYDDFPTNSEFKKPDYIHGDVKWGTIQHIGGKIRVAGYLCDDVFYIVFLDKEHKFFPSYKKHT